MADKTNSKTLAKIAVVENCFGSSGKPLVAPGRVLLREDILTKICRKEPKLRIFFMFNDCLVYGSIVTHKKKYNKQHIIPLEQVTLAPLKDANEKYGWIISTSTKSFAVYADTLLTKLEWEVEFDRCLSDLKKSGKEPAEQHAAVWVPNSEAPVCQVCRNRFTFVNRRHHCRKCGSVICGQCSKHRALLPNQSGKMLRVCNPCHNGISGNSPDSNIVFDLVKV